jgi:hypothetical protein
LVKERLDLYDEMSKDFNASINYSILEKLHIDQNRHLMDHHCEEKHPEEFKLFKQRLREKEEEDKKKIIYKVTHGGPNDYRNFQQKYDRLQKMKKSGSKRGKSARYRAATVASVAKNLCAC